MLRSLATEEYMKNGVESDQYAVVSLGNWAPLERATLDSITACRFQLGSYSVSI